MATALLEWLWIEFQWPRWASASCLALSLCLVLLHALGWVVKRESGVAPSTTMTTMGVESNEFKRFRREYLVVYFLVMFADWLQGTHMYSLYESYDMNISALFLSGFLSSALFGSIVGPSVDKYGRRNACLMFCVLEIVINLLENIPDMAVLMVGRVLGGISTSLLFSAFESWMVTEHRARGFPEALIPRTFAFASEGNGLLAVLAGITAQITADAFGEIGPFRLAVLVTVLALVFIFQWTENYGSEEPNQESTKASNSSKEASVPSSPWSRSVYTLGLCYSLFEGAMYVFVFLWYPTLYAVVPDSLLPSGLVFSSFMLCIALGGKIYELAGSKIGEEILAVLLCALSACLLAVPAVTNEFGWILAAFLVFELCVGAFSPCSGTLRSRYFPNERMSTILSTFRLPTNVIVVAGTAATNYFQHPQMFQFCALVMALAATCGLLLLSSRAAVSGTKTKTS